MICSTRILVMLVICLMAFHRLEAADAIDQVSGDLADLRGLVVSVGEMDEAKLGRLVSAAPVLMLSIVSDEAARSRKQAVIDQGGFTGRWTVVAVSSGGRIPLATRSAALVLHDTAARADLEAEVQRVVRPLGHVISGSASSWQVNRIARPDTMDDWTHYHYDATSSEHSKDTVVGEPRGLQWVAGPTNTDLLSTTIIDDVFIGQYHQKLTREQATAIPVLMGRDALRSSAVAAR